MHQKADVVYADHHRHGAAQRRGVLHVQQVGTILAELHRQFDSQPNERVRGDLPGLKPLGRPLPGIVGGKVSDEVRFVVQRRKAPQQAANIHFVSGEMAADGVSINREAHQIFPW